MAVWTMVVSFCILQHTRNVFESMVKNKNGYLLLLYRIKCIWFEFLFFLDLNKGVCIVYIMCYTISFKEVI